MKRVIDKKAYNTETAERIATQFSCGRTADLYRTKKGSYFIVHETCWQGEWDTLTPLSQNEAIVEYENMSDQTEEFEKAFPGVEIEEA